MNNFSSKQEVKIERETCLATGQSDVSKGNSC